MQPDRLSQSENLLLLVRADDFFCLCSWKPEQQVPCPPNTHLEGTEPANPAVAQIFAINLELIDFGCNGLAFLLPDTTSSGEAALGLKHKQLQ